MAKKKKAPKLGIQTGICKSALRRIFVRCDLYNLALNSAVSDDVGPRGGRLYDCSCCGGHFGSGKVVVDHIEPVIPIGLTVNDMHIGEVADRMWCVQYRNPLDNLQVLCKPCHDEKTIKERAERKIAKKKNKGEL